jgi:hypothetical protein
MSAWQSKIDKKTNQQMKNNANFSYQRPKDFITVFGQHVMEEFPHALPKTSSQVNVKPKIEIKRVNQSQVDNSRITLRDIFYKGGDNSEDALRLKNTSSNSLAGVLLHYNTHSNRREQLVVEEAEFEEDREPNCNY